MPRGVGNGGRGQGKTAPRTLKIGKGRKKSGSERRGKERRKGKEEKK